MTSKQYISYVLATVFFVLGSIISVNLYLNDFGLFGDRENIRIWGVEKTSKYLLSFNYIPDNFEGVLIGPSISTNMDTQKINGFKIYNLSMNSGNVSELKYPVDNVLNSGKMKYLIICLYSYLTKDSGRKGRQIDEKEYWGSLYSIIPLRLMLRRLKSILWSGDDIFHNSEWGFNDSNIKKKNLVFNDFVEKRRKTPRSEISINSDAYKELKSIIELARAKDVKIMAYYYPVYFEYTGVYRKSGAWKKYQDKVNKLFSSDDLVWDMNLPDYDYITHNQSSYVDGHLSYLGADKVLSVIEIKLKTVKK